MARSSPYGSPAVTTDIVIFTIEDGALKVLLIKRAAAPFQGKRALPGGFLLKGETTAQAAARILVDKTGVHQPYIAQLATFDERGRDPRGHIMSVAYYALAPRTKLRLGTGASAQHPALEDVRQAKGLAFDHDRILKAAVDRVRSKLTYTNLAYSLLPAEFTFQELQQTYETILGRPLDKRNFRKKYLSLDLIEATHGVRKGGRHRPARLYRFKSARLTELPRWL
jgi:ADP-ribose pyrophosphatase YjhB (NUDIX family)